MKTRKVYNGSPFSAMYISGSININVELKPDEKITDKKVKVVKKGKKEYKVLECPIRKKSELLDPSGNVLALDVDQFSGKKFLLNSSGFPMNDIMIYEQAQSDSIARAALQRINVVGSNSDDGLTLEQRFERIVPSNWSSPAEWLRACETFGRLQYAKKMSEQRDDPGSPESSDSTISFANDPKPETV